MSETSKPSIEVLAMGADKFFAPVFTGSWAKLPITDQVKFRNDLAAYVKACAKIRAKFDQTVWAGHTDGSVNAAVESIRAERSEDAATPGRKAKVKTMEEILLGE